MRVGKRIFDGVPIIDTVIDQRDIGKAGRNLPVIACEAFPGGLGIRVDFDGDPQAWVEICIPWHQIARVKAAKDAWDERILAKSDVQAVLTAGERAQKNQP